MGLFAVWFAAKQHIITWPASLINVTCFFAVFYQVQLYSDMFLQVYFFGISVYGWVIWKMQKQEGKPIQRLSNKQRIQILIWIAALTGIFGYFIQHLHDYFPSVFQHPAAFPYVDSFIAVASIFANTLLARRIFENWVLWIVIDAICIFVYALKHILFISFEYFIFFFMASYGLYEWVKIMKDEKRLSTR